MSWLDQVGGLLSSGGEQGGALGIAQELLSQNGGLSGLLARFQESGLGEQAASWVSQGENLPISAEQIQSALGSEQLSALADKFGLDVGALSSQLAEYVPGVIDKLSPDGTLPADGGDLLSQGASLLKGFLNR